MLLFTSYLLLIVSCSNPCNPVVVKDMPIDSPIVHITSLPERSIVGPSVIEESIDTVIFAPLSTTGKYAWQYGWNKFCEAEIRNHQAEFLGSNEFLKQDIDKLCPGFYTMTNNQKIAFWTLFIAAIVKPESGFDPNCRFKESESLDYVYSEGLLQLSYGDETRHLGIPLSTAAKNILDPETNLRSGISILANQIKTKQVLFPERFYYWSVLTNAQPQADLIEYFKTQSVGLTGCN